MPTLGAVHVLRTMPMAINPGATVDVTIEVTSTQALTVTLAETAPPGWAMAAATNLNAPLAVKPGTPVKASYKLTAPHTEGPVKVQGTATVTGGGTLSYYTVVAVYPRVTISDPQETKSIASRLITVTNFDDREGQLLLGDPLRYFQEVLNATYTAVAARWVRTDFAFSANGLPVAPEIWAQLASGDLLRIVGIKKVVLELETPDDPCLDHYPAPSPAAVPEYPIKV